MSKPFYDEKYFKFISDIQDATREMIKTIIVETFIEIDLPFKNSTERSKKYVVDKSNAPRTITTISVKYHLKKHTINLKLIMKNIFYRWYVWFTKIRPLWPVVKALAIDKAISTSQAEAERTIGERICLLSDLLSNKRSLKHISRQILYNWINKWDVPNHVYEQVPNTPNSLYIMFDEKYIGYQDLDGDIMI